MSGDTNSGDPYATREVPETGRSDLFATKSDAAPAVGTGSGAGRLEVRCPNCHAPTAVAVDTLLTDLTCSSCGSHFSLVDQSKDTRMAPALTQMGRFELIERLGVGGFGSVWKARDKELDRTVAIKIPRAGAMSPDEQEKFFREARAAAQLRHPGIVSVFEVGREADSIYIVSEFIRGVTLGDWLTCQKLTSREAAELCAKIADSLHHAHEQGIIHRDLKPANVMMGYDGQPHLTDFGLARREVGEVTVTMDGQVLGTPAYMSPEQAAGEAHTADSRSDVYSLGVILFQLLTGELPFRGNVRMLMKQVIHDEPPSPRKLNSNVPKDLETITLRCLEKEPSRRYQSAHELSDECRRVLSDTPIKARPVTRFERAVRWTRRNKAVSAVSAFALLSLLAGTIVSLVFALDARRNAEAANASETAAQAALDLETDLFAAARPQGQEGGLGYDVTLREAIDATLPKLDSVFQDHPLVEARIRNTLGISYARLGEEERAATQFELARNLYRQQAGHEPDALQCANNLANTYNELGRYREALKLHQETLARRKDLLGIDSRDTLSTMSSLAEDYSALGRESNAVALLEETLGRQKIAFGTNDKDTLGTMNELANSYHVIGRNSDAIALYEETLARRKLALISDHPNTLTAMNGLASAYYAVGRFSEALKLHEETLAKRKAKLGNNHSATIATINCLAWRLATLPVDQLRNGKRAVQLALEACDRTQYKNAEYVDTLAAAYAETGDFEAAVKWSEHSLDLIGKNGDSNLRQQFSLRLLEFKGKKPIRHENRKPEQVVIHNRSTSCF